MLCIATAMMIVSGDAETADCNKTQPLEASSVVLVVSTVTFTIFMNAGPQPVRWILVGELFRQNSRGSAGAVAVFTSRLVSSLKLADLIQVVLPIHTILSIGILTFYVDVTVFHTLTKIILLFKVRKNKPGIDPLACLP